MIRFRPSRVQLVVLALDRGRSVADVIERITTVVQAARRGREPAECARLTSQSERRRGVSKSSTPIRRYRQLSMRAEDFVFFDDFAARLSEREGFRLTTIQALKRAVVRYTATNKLTGEKVLVYKVNNRKEAPDESEHCPKPR